MRGFAILILIVLFFWIIWPLVSRWLKRKAMERAEDYMRASMGMPPRSHQRNSHTSKNQRNHGFSYQDNATHHSKETFHGPIIPKEYAEDVEFIETIDYSHTERSSTTFTNGEIYHESQISDVEYIEIKKSGSK